MERPGRVTRFGSRTYNAPARSTRGRATESTAAQAAHPRTAARRRGSAACPRHGRLRRRERVSRRRGAAARRANTQREAREEGFPAVSHLVRTSDAVAGHEPTARSRAHRAIARRSATESNAASARSEVTRPACPSRGCLRRRERVDVGEARACHRASARRKTAEANCRPVQDGRRCRRSRDLPQANRATARRNRPLRR
jgi:hypothetical protein